MWKIYNLYISQNGPLITFGVILTSGNREGKLHWKDNSVSFLFPIQHRIPTTDCNDKFNEKPREHQAKYMFFCFVFLFLCVCVLIFQPVKGVESTSRTERSTTKHKNHTNDITNVRSHGDCFVFINGI